MENFYVTIAPYMIKPTLLKKGDTVGVVAPSDYVYKKDVHEGISMLKKWGLNVRVGKYVYEKNLDFQAGTLRQRQEDFLTIARDPNVKIIWAAGGGYASFDILEFFEKEILPILVEQKKTIIGYSDTTAFQVLLFKNGVVSIQAPNVGGISMWDTSSQNKLKKLLFTGFPEKSEDGKCDVKSGIRVVRPSLEVAKGRLMAGNLEAMIDSISAGYDFLSCADFPLILGVEELLLHKSDIRRYAEVISMHPKASRIKGMILGRFVYNSELDYPEWSEKNRTGDIFRKHVGDKLQIPIVQTYKWGHFWETESLRRLLKLQKKERRSFYPLPNGVEVEMHTWRDKGRIRIKESVFAKN